MKLTASEIRLVDELEADRRAIETTLRVALNFHANKINDLQKREKEMWQLLSEHHHFDINDECGWRIGVVEGAVSIVENDK